MASRTERLINAVADRLRLVDGTGESGVDLRTTLCLHPPSVSKAGVGFVYLVRHGDRLDSGQTQLGERDQGPILAIDLIHSTDASTGDLETVHLTSVRLLDEVFAVLSTFGSWLDDLTIPGEEAPDLLATSAFVARKSRMKTAGTVSLDITFDWPYRPGAA